MIIDMRLRPPHGDWLDGPSFDTAMYYPRKVGYSFGAAPSAVQRSMDRLFQEMDEVGISRGVIMGRQSGSELGKMSNESVLATLRQWPDRFIGFIATDLENIPASLEQIRHYSRFREFRGVSIEPGSSVVPVSADDRALDPIYEACLEVGLPVSVSLSSTLSAIAGHDLTWANPAPVQRVAMKYPDLKIIVSHAAWPWAELMVAIAIVCPNIYVSPDMYIATRNMPGTMAYVDAANLCLEDRTLFGSAYPSRNLKGAVTDFRSLPWRPEIVDKILWSNAARLLGVMAS